VEEGLDTAGIAKKPGTFTTALPLKDGMNARLAKVARACALAASLALASFSARAGEASFSQRTFHTPEDATNALVKAAKMHDVEAMHELFGSDVTNFMTGDRTLDERHFDSLAKDLSDQCDAVQDRNDKVLLEIGKTAWSFPVPLVKTNGVWLFDTPAGEEEIVNRHIGRDEYYAIGVCHAFVNAQRKYADQFGHAGAPKYAMHFRSAPGKTDGLYWPSSPQARPSPLVDFVAEASTEGYTPGSGNAPRPYHGYFFKILTGQGPEAPGGKMDYVHHGEMTRGFAMVAYPVRWGVSGIMTFIVNQDGAIYQRSLGEKTFRIATAMKLFNPDKEWSAVTVPGVTDLTADTPSEIDVGRPR
jgi:hypothetical protein